MHLVGAAVTLPEDVWELMCSYLTLKEWAAACGPAGQCFTCSWEERETTCPLQVHVLD
jgi:hypothetical protein